MPLKEFEELIPLSLQRNSIPGFAIAVIDKDSIRWADAFGVLNSKILPAVIYKKSATSQ
jgi:hypothetical protein